MDPNLPQVENASPTKVSTTLFITTTLLTGEPSRFTDTYGTLIQDVDHRGMFRFTENTLNQADALALAARSSASFPAAFEPSFLPYAEPVPASGPVPRRPAVGAMSNITRSHWVADGGLLDNQPIDAVLETIFQRPARRLVRRVLLYIVPTTGPAQDPLKPVPGDDVTKPYDMIGSLLKDFSAVLNQSISADLRSIREHNERIGVRTDMRQRLAQLAIGCGIDRQSDDLLLLTDGLFSDYRAREADQLARRLVPELLRLLSTWPTAAPNTGQPAPGSGPRHAAASSPAGGEQPTLPESWAASLLPGSTAEQKCHQMVHTVLAERWPAKPSDVADLAAFGRDAFYGGKAIALSMLRCGFLLAEWDPQGGPGRTPDLVRMLTKLHGAYQPDEDRDVETFVQDEAVLPEIQALSLPEAVGELARRYLDAIDRPAAQNAGAPNAGAQNGGAQNGGTQNGGTQNGGAQAATDVASMEAAWRDIGSVVAALVADPVVTAALSQPVAPTGSRAEQVATAAEHLRTYAGYLTGAADDRSRALRLFALYAAHRAMLPAEARVDQPVELIQLSSDTRTLLDLNRSTAHSKLTGVQLNHFGAFFKRSWRANDWMWGRLDGVGWLTHVLLDPRRINTIAIAKDGSRASGFLSQLEAIGIPEPPSGAGIPVTPATNGNQQMLSVDTIRDELAFLDDPTAEVPVSLPLTALWVARGRQQQVVADETPALAQAILDPELHESATGAARSWATTVQETTPADRQRDAAKLLASCPVPDERVQSELGTPLMVRTVSKAAAVTAAALHAMPQIPPPIRPATSAMRTITLAGYRVVNLVRAWPRRIILVGLALLLVGGLLATAQSTVFGLTGMLIAAIGGYLVVFGAWQTSRAVLAAVLSATVVGGAASLTIPSVRHGLFGKQGDKAGWLNDRVLWLGERWWHPLAGLGVVLLLLALIGMLFARHGKATAPVHRLPRWLAVLGAALVALAVVAGLAIALAIKGS